MAMAVHPDTAIGAVRPDGHGPRPLARLLRAGARSRGAETEDGTLALGARRPAAADRRSSGDAAAPALDRRATGLFHLALLRPLAPRSGAGPRAPRRAALAARRRLRPPRERGAVPVRSGRKRHRDLPRPPARGMAANERRAADGDAAARSRRHHRASSDDADDRADRCPPGTRHRPRAPAGRRPRRARRRSTTACSASTSSSAPTRARCSSPPAATTTTSG